MGLIPVAMRARLARLRAGRFGWPALALCLLGGGVAAVAMERMVPHARAAVLPERGHGPSRAATRGAHKLDYALRWIKLWPERAPRPGRAGRLAAEDFALAEGLRSRYEAQFPGSPIATQLAIQEAADGSDREQQVWNSRAFAELCAQPARTIAALGDALDDGGAGAGQIARLLLAVSQATGTRAGLPAIYRRAFTRPARAGEPGSEAALVALYGQLRLDGDAAVQRAAVRDALGAQGSDAQMQAALRRVVLLRSEELFR